LKAFASCLLPATRPDGQHSSDFHARHDTSQSALDRHVPVRHEPDTEGQPFRAQAEPTPPSTPAGSQTQHTDSTNIEDAVSRYRDLAFSFRNKAPHLKGHRQALNLPHFLTKSSTPRHPDISDLERILRSPAGQTFPSRTRPGLQHVPMLASSLLSSQIAMF
jgi:hypothetical protein